MNSHSQNENKTSTDSGARCWLVVTIHRGAGVHPLRSMILEVSTCTHRGYVSRKGTGVRIPYTTLGFRPWCAKSALSDVRITFRAISPTAMLVKDQVQCAEGLRQRSFSVRWALSLFMRSPMVVRTPRSLSRHCETLQDFSTFLRSITMLSQPH